MSALMKIRAIFVFTHDSIGLGEDGPTHQPVEHVESLRFITKISVWRPCDTVDTEISWRSAVERVDWPTWMLFSRKNQAKVALIHFFGIKKAPKMLPKVVRKAAENPLLCVLLFHIIFGRA